MNTDSDKLLLLNYLEGFITEERKQRFLQILSERTNFFTVAIEDVYQLHNTSAVIRSCDAFGVQQVHVVEEQFGKRLDKNIAMGSQKWVDIYRHATTTDCIDKLKSENYKIVATTPHDGVISLEELSINEPLALFFGTEKSGLSETVMQNADVFLKIPMRGFAESLNISVSAAIILQHLTAKLRKTQINWQLSKEEMLEKRIDWTKKSIRSVEDVLKSYYEK
ncbi:TrmH family RNA methyltransferase [Galbibacter mesophilus]|uniref:TrmH family RNA methyltransferase n=1 Tax=Galbibacter mesophilus TaxID=379069 RepID=UPI00191DB62B|nr:RNA methyltransferase [Galbibacter mesophilus]MCM5664127.1 RNA methyltransferase [Galbibacter mesophilus]